MGRIFSLPLLAVVVVRISSSHGQIALYNSSSFAHSTVSLSLACQAALTTSIACDNALLLYATTNFAGGINDTVLSTQLCPQTCAKSLSSYHNSVASACAKDQQPWPGQPVTYFGDLLWAYQNQTCLKDGASGAYCASESVSSPTRY